MGKLILLLVIIVCIIGAIMFVASMINNWFNNDANDTGLFWCACGCGRKFNSSAGWDGYHGPDWNNPAYWDANMLEYRKAPQKAIDYEPDNVVGWEDIQWTVEKRLKDKQ